ncbi:hypothetical protein Fcan01_28190 [Folsomia candida]|uniref:Uncharacterized protein n=1 Tax=Folsomia candida TaxID=158441 RepID=A0A226CWN8_FOLCA|nr:hypothetical protein Fcan01_28190 [Folsomia candida]
MPIASHIYPVPPCHEHSMRQPLPPHQNHLRHLQRRGFTWASSSFETTHDGWPGHPSTISIHEGSVHIMPLLKHTPLTGNASSGLPLADTTGKTHAPKHDNFTHADAHASSHSPGSTVSRAFNANNHSLHTKSFTTPAEEEASHGPVAVSKQHTRTRRAKLMHQSMTISLTLMPMHLHIHPVPPCTSIQCDNHSLHTKIILRHPAEEEASHGPVAVSKQHTTDTTGKTHAPKHDNFTPLMPMHLHSPGSTVSRAFNATTTPSTPKSFTTPAEQEASHGPVAVSKQHTTAFNATTTPSTPKSFTTPAEEEASHGPVAVSKQHTTGEPGHPSTISIHEGSSSHHATLKHTPLTGNASSGLPLADTTGKTHAPKHDNFTHADAHASSHSPGSTVSRAFNATTTPSTPKSFTTPAEEEASHGPVAVSKQHTTGEPGHPSTISIHEGSSSHHATLKHTPLTGNASSGLPLADTTGKLMHQSMTISLTLMPMHLHIHPVPPCHEHSMRQPLPPHQIIYDTCRGRGFTWASSSFETTHDGHDGQTHAPKHDNFTPLMPMHLHIHPVPRVTSIQCDNHSLHTKIIYDTCRGRGFTWASSSFETTQTDTTGKTHAPKHDNFTHADAHASSHSPVPRVTSIQCDNHSLHTKIIYDTCRGEASHGPVAVSKQHTTGEPGHPSTISIHEGSSSHHATLKHTPLTAFNATTTPSTPKSFTTPAEEEASHGPVAVSKQHTTDTTGKTHAPKHDNFTHADAHASSHSPGSTVSRAFNATTTPSTPKSFTTPAEEEASHGPVAVSKQHTTDTTGKTHAPKHDNFTHADAHASSHSPGSTVSRAFNATTTPSTPKSFTTPAEEEASHGPVAVSKQHTTVVCHLQTRRAKLMHQSMTISLTLMPMHLHIHPVPPCQSIHATTTPSTPKSFTTPAEQEASHGPVAVSKQHTTGEPGHPSTISIHEGSSSHHATLKHTPLTGNASSGLPLADTTGKTHAPKHDNFTHADAHASSHSPGSTVSRAFNATTTPSTPKSFTTPAEEEASHGPVAVSKQHDG